MYYTHYIMQRFLYLEYIQEKKLWEKEEIGKLESCHFEHFFILFHKGLFKLCLP